MISIFDAKYSDQTIKILPRFWFIQTSFWNAGITQSNNKMS